jgi:hypothetical protein
MTFGLRAWPALAGAAALYACLAIVIALTIGPRASPPPGAMAGDQQVYRAMAAHPFALDPADLKAPWCWRVLPSLIVRATGLGPDLGFHVLTVTSFALLPAAVMVLLLALRVSPLTAGLIGGVAATVPPLAGYLAWAYAMTDAFAVLVCVGAVWSTVTRRAVPLAVCLVALALTKETWIVTAAFAVLWTRAHHRPWLPRVLVIIAVAALVNVSLRFAIHPSESYSALRAAQGLYLPLSMSNILRRLLLATGTTWNVLTPILALSLARLWRGGRGIALAVPIALAMLQPLVATETIRPVASAYPFVLIACALELDRWSPGWRRVAGGVVIAAQFPWLLEFGYVAHFPLRGIEIALVLTAVVLIPFGWRRPAA